MKKISSFLALFLILVFSSCSNDENLDSSESVGLVSSYVDYDDSFGVSGDNYNQIVENPFIDVSEESVSTFSIDADGASYANIRRFIMQDGQIPPSGALRTEEMINYFNLDYEYSDTAHPINLNGEISTCPWNSDNKLVRVGIKGKSIEEASLPASNYVFLIDVSGSMSSEDKLEMLKSGFNYFVDEMKPTDKVAIVTYAGNAGVLLESTFGDEKDKIKNAINSLGAGGSTAGAEGIVTAYEIAQQNFITGGNNRIIIGTDGDFNVGPSSQEGLVKLIEEKRELGIYITVLGVGRGNLNEGALEQIANNGNGNFEYIDTIEQLRKVFVYEYSKFYTVAKDVKVQVEFNEEQVKSYRLIGYENRVLENDDFEDDAKDAGEIGANQNITALYEIVPAENALTSGLAFTVDFRYKKPDSDVSIPISMSIYDEGKSFEAASDFTKFTAAIASFSMLVNDSEYKGNSSYDAVLNWLNQVNLNDEFNFKSEFKTIVQRAKNID